jgi:hypothetical protein
MHQQVFHLKSLNFAHRVYLCLSYNSTLESEITFMHRIKGLVYVIGIGCVYSATRNESLKIIQTKSPFKVYFSLFILLWLHDKIIWSVK